MHEQNDIVQVVVLKKKQTVVTHSINLINQYIAKKFFLRHLVSRNSIL